MADLTDRQPASRAEAPVRRALAPAAQVLARRAAAALRAWALDAGVELLAILVWTLVIAAPYTNLDPGTAPAGIEYYTLIQTNHVWTRVEECGACALWNGSLRGGAPAFVDPHASLLHPLVIVTTLLFGVIVGSKLALVCAFFLAGVAQWWLGRALGLGRVARVWAAGMAVTAGFLAAQMSEGLFSMVLSTVSCALALPALLRLAQTGSRRSAVALGVVLALAIVAGQGYIQIALALVLPAALLIPRPLGRRVLLRRYTLAGAIAGLLAAPFLAPFLHFLPQFHKSSDANFVGAQPLTYVLFNLVIADRGFYTTDALGKLPYPFLYANFIGWTPLLLALWGLRASRDDGERRSKLFLVVAAFLPLWLASAAPLRWLAHQDALPWLAAQAASVRNCSVTAGLAIPPILALAGLGLDRLLAIPWLQLEMTVGRRGNGVWPLEIDLRWLLAVPLIVALSQAQSFGKGWISVEAVPFDIEPAVAELRTSDIQWVNTPIGDNPWEERAVAMGLKLAYGFRAWDWGDRPLPKAVLMLSRKDELPDMIRQHPVKGGMYLYAPAVATSYATLTLDGGSQAACEAHGSGGALEVMCEAAQPGVLMIDENNWSGWRAWVDGQPAPLLDTQRLELRLLAGRHTVSLRYQPWDVPLGVALWLAGVTLALYSWRRGS